MGIRIATRCIVVGLCCLLNLALSLFALGQTTPMTNEDVIELVEGGLGASVLVAAIGRADTVEFDVDGGLLDLARAGVPDAVITAMIEKQPEQDDAEAATAAAVAGTARSPGIYLIEEEGIGRRLEPTAYSAASASGRRARLTLGIAGDQAKATVPGRAPRSEPASTGPGSDFPDVFRNDGGFQLHVPLQHREYVRKAQR